MKSNTQNQGTIRRNETKGILSQKLSPCRRLFLAIVGMLFTASPAALATDVAFTGSATGAGTVGWVGTITGQIDNVSFTDSETERSWASHGELIADPPIYEPEPLRGDSVHAMYALIKFVVDRFSVPHVPDQPTDLQLLTSNEHTAIAHGYSDAYGISLRATATVEGVDPSICTGTIDVELNDTLPELDGHYIITGRTEPSGPGAATMLADVAIFSGADVAITIEFEVEYAFDPSLVLEAGHDVYEEAWYTIEDGEQQVLTVDEVYTESAMTSEVSEPELSSSGWNIGSFPNPFDEATDLSFSQPVSGDLRVDVFNAAGREVRTLIDGEVSAGKHVVTWDGRTHSGEPAGSGTYYCRISGQGQRETIRLTRIR